MGSLMDHEQSANWNPWHGCTKCSEGCRYCYVYRQDAKYGSEIASSLCRKTQAFALPVQRKRDGGFRIPSGSTVYTCFTSDFLLEDADEWRAECWRMMRQRPDCRFLFFTKRIERFRDCLPPDWGSGYENVAVGCTCENQKRADQRLPVFAELPIRHKLIIIGPMLTPVDVSAYLGAEIEEVSCSGESGENVRPLRYDWVLDVRRQCMEKQVPFTFHQTGACLIKDGRAYRIPRGEQLSQARKAHIDYRPDTHSENREGPI